RRPRSGDIGASATLRPIERLNVREGNMTGPWMCAVRNATPLDRQAPRTRPTGPGFATALALATAFLLAACATPKPIVSPIPVVVPPSAPATPAPTPTPAPPVPLAWYQTRVTGEFSMDSLGETMISAAAAAPGGYFAVGSSPSGGTTWSSIDGATWVRNTDGVFRSLKNARLTSVAVGRVAIDEPVGRVVAVAAGMQIGYDHSERPALWSGFADGGPDPVSSFPALSLAADSSPTSAESIAGVVWVEKTGFLALGDLDGTTNIWRSADGFTWTRSAAGATFEGAHLAGLVAGGDHVAAWGSGASGQMIWASVDGGATWTAEPAPTPALATIVAAGQDLWAFGREGQVYHSIDGLTWTKTGSLPPIGGGSPIVQQAGARISGSGPALVVIAIGDLGGGSYTESVALNSSDGATWSLDTSPTGSNLGLVSFIGSSSTGFYALGSSNGKAAAWLARDASMAPPPTVPPVVPAVATCPKGAVDLVAILGVAPDRRADCFEDRTLKFSAFNAQPEGIGGTVDSKGTPDWLAGAFLNLGGAWLSPLDGPFNPAASLNAYARPGLKGLAPTPRWVAVSGHFDDPVATTCRITKLGDGSLSEPVAVSVARCRNSFVVTAVTHIDSPDPGDALRIGVPYVLERWDGGLDGGFEGPPQGETGLANWSVWSNGQPLVAMFVFRFDTVAHAKAFAGRQTEWSGAGQTVTLSGVPVWLASAGDAAHFALGNLAILMNGYDGTTLAEMRSLLSSLIAASA
ncbi:MAG: hypothetical protein ABI555_01100, partial [Chloroflexota bacterium]